jgi:acetyl esterase/lipase
MVGRREWLASIFGACAGLRARAQAVPYPPEMAGARAEVYKTVAETALRLYIFDRPDGPAKDRAAIVFFFGGGWRNGSPQQFEMQCRHLASRGMVAITADYRVESRNGARVVDCVRDAKSAIRWVRQNARRLGIDPDRIAGGGGSAGGHLAAAAGLIRDLDEPGEDQRVTSRPNALVLFNPAVVLPIKGAGIEERAGIPVKAISPYEHVGRGAPPTIIFHGRADTTVPYATVELFAKRMAEAGNRCEVAGFEGEQHGFFNYGRGGNRRYRETLAKMDEFLVSLGYLKPAPRQVRAIRPVYRLAAAQLRRPLP